MRIFVLICSALLVFAAALELLSFGYQPDALINLFLAQPLVQKLAWLVIFVVPLLLIGVAFWQGESLLQQRKVAGVLEARLGGISRQAKELSDLQKDVDQGTDHLGRTDPEDAIAALQRRLSEAERTAQLQQTRNEQGDLQTRLDDVRRQQQALRERLGTTLERRRAIEPAVVDLQRSQDDIERTLLDIEGADLQVRLCALTEANQRMHSQCDEIERALAAFLHLKDELGGLQTRLAPLQDPQAGVKGVLHATHATRDQLIASINYLDRDEETNLAHRVKTLAETKQELAGSVAGLIDQFSRLNGLHGDIGGLLAKLKTQLDVHGAPRAVDSPA